MRRARPVHDLTRRSTCCSVYVTVTEIAPVQELHDALQISVAQAARNLRRGHPDLRELSVGEGEHENASKAVARALPVMEAVARSKCPRTRAGASTPLLAPDWRIVAGCWRLFRCAGDHPAARRLRAELDAGPVVARRVFERRRAPRSDF
jgi:hypothetical protein